MIVFPESMNRLDINDSKKSIQVMESYINYMCERVDFAINNMTTNLASQGDVAPYLAEKLEEVTSALNQVSSSVGSLSGTVTNLVNRTKAVEDSLEEIETTISTIDEKINLINENIKSLDERVTALEGGKNNGIY